MSRPRLSLHAIAALKPPKTRKPHPVDTHDAAEIRRAVAFTCCIFRGYRPGQLPFDRLSFASLAEARAAKGEHPRSIVYAISARGFTYHVPDTFTENDQ